MELAICGFGTENLRGLKPNRSVLYPLEPIGLGTYYVESMDSYVARLAEAHSASPYTLVTQEFCEPFNRTSYSLREMFFRRTSEVFGFSQIASEVANVVGELTGLDSLKSLTFIRWGEVLTARGLFKKHKSWCPKCLEGWRINGIVYSPLIWNLELVQMCNIHKCGLESFCPHCGKCIPLLSGTARTGYCSFCKCWLGSEVREKMLVLNNTELCWNEYVINSFGTLLAVANNLEVAPSVDILKSNLKKILICIPSKDYGKLGFNRKSMSEWLDGKYIPQTINLLKIGYFFNIPLCQMFLKDITEINYLPRCEGVLRKSKGSLFENDLKNFISDLNTPSIKSVCSHFGCTDKTLKRNYPEIYSMLISIHENNKEETKIRKIESVLEIKRIMRMLMSNGIYPSKRKVFGSVKWSFSMSEFQEVWHYNKSELGL